MRPTAARIAIVSLIGLSLAASQPAKAQSVYNLDFSTANQNMWGSGSSLTYDYYQKFGPSWDLSGSVGGVSDHWYGDYGIGLSGSTSGQVGLYASLHADSGSVNVNLPVSVELDYTDPTTWKKGDPIHVSSSYTIQPGASLNTVSPNGKFEVGGFIDATAKASVEVGYGVGTASKTIVDTSINTSTAFLTLDSQTQHSVSDPNNILTATGGLPYITTNGTLVGNKLVASGSDNFLSLRGDLTNAITAALGAPNLLNNSGSWGPFEGGYSILDAGVSANFGANQNFSFDPQLMMKLVGSNGQTFIVPVGTGVDFTLPSDISSFNVQPTFFLDDTFTSQTSLSISPEVDFTPLSAYAGAFGYDITFDPFGTLTWSPGSYDLATLYNNSWQLGGFQSFSTDPLSWNFDTAAVPEPSSLALAFSLMVVGTSFLKRRRK